MVIEARQGLRSLLRFQGKFFILLITVFLVGLVCGDCSCQLKYRRYKTYKSYYQLYILHIITSLSMVLLYYF